MCCSPLLFWGVDIFCTNAHGICWMIGAIFVEFSHLILLKSIEIIATRCQILKLKCTKFNFGYAGEAYSALPDPLAGFKGPNSKGRGRERWKWRERRGPFYFFLQIYTRVQGLFAAQSV